MVEPARQAVRSIVAEVGGTAGMAVGELEEDFARRLKPAVR